MTSTVDATEIPDLPTRHDLESLAASVRQVHAQIRLISAANFAGFIELSRSEQRDALSHPSRVRGSKQGVDVQRPDQPCVAPLAGAWIETVSTKMTLSASGVAPLA